MLQYQIKRACVDNYWQDDNFSVMIEGTDTDGTMDSVIVNYSLSSGLELGTDPEANGEAGEVFVQGFLGVPMEPVSIYPVTPETVVDYTITSGALPPGLTMETEIGNGDGGIQPEGIVSMTGVYIVGTPTQAGEYTVVVRGEDVVGEIDSVIINFSISSRH